MKQYTHRVIVNDSHVNSYRKIKYVIKMRQLFNYTSPE